MIGFAKKIGMTRLFIGGKNVAVTAIQFDSQFVLQRKTVAVDGYSAVQVAAFKKSKKTNPVIGHIKKYSELEQNFRCLEEFRDFELPEDKSTIDINDFSDTDSIDITGTTKGHGFTGVVKRYDFAGQPASHGHDHERAPGSIGTRWPQRTLAGKRMAGRDGGSRVTVKGAKIVAIDQENRLIFVNGSVPGANKSFLKIRKVVKVV